MAGVDAAALRIDEIRAACRHKDRGWLAALQPADLILDDPECVVITRAAFDQLQDYTRSQPTGPSTGRIWKKNFHWSGPPDNWFICLVGLPDGEPGLPIFQRHAEIVE